MCRSQAQGGQRCYSHAKQARQRAAAQHQQALDEYNKIDRATYKDDPHAWDDVDGPLGAARVALKYAARTYYNACADFASTPRGFQELTDEITANGLQDNEGLQMALELGPQLRAAAQERGRRNRQRQRELATTPPDEFPPAAFQEPCF